MTSILAILLYLNAISCCTTYTSCQIQQQADLHQQEITNIQNDPALNDQVQAEYGDEANSIYIIDDVCH